MEGPFGDHTGFYSLADLYPRDAVTAVTMKQQPIYAATLVGRPPMEDYWLGHATERIFLPLLKLTVPGDRRLSHAGRGIFHNLVFVSIDKQYPGQAYKVMHALWGQGLMSLAKVLVIVDKEVNVHDADEVWWVALNHIDPKRDVEFVRGPGRRARPRVAALHLRQQDGDRRHPEVARGRLHARMAGADRDGRRDEGGAWMRCGEAGIEAWREIQRAVSARRADVPRASALLALRVASSSCRTPSSRCRSRCSACSPPSRVDAAHAAHRGARGASHSVPRDSPRWASTGLPTGCSTRRNPRTRIARSRAE